MRLLNAAAAVLIAASITACALPNTNVRAGAVRPTLVVKGAPDSAALYVDGVAAGRAAEFDGVTKVLNVEEGSHQVEIRIGDSVIHKERIFISSGEARVVTVGSARQ
jgi:hypothetical protein